MNKRTMDILYSGQDRSGHNGCTGGFFLNRQIALADLAIVNKTDLVEEEALQELRDTVRSAQHHPNLGLL